MYRIYKSMEQTIHASHYAYTYIKSHSTYAARNDVPVANDCHTVGNFLKVVIEHFHHSIM